MQPNRERESKRYKSNDNRRNADGSKRWHIGGCTMGPWTPMRGVPEEGYVRIRGESKQYPQA
jgi:hypothetical protein